MKTTARLLIFLSVLLVSCSTILPQPTVTPVPTSTPLPTETSAPTFTPQPSATATIPAPIASPTTETSVADLVPQGTPEKEWHGIAIMPGALAGSGDDGSYRFTIKASQAEIKSFYDKELEKAGWMSLGLGSSENGNSLTIFLKGEKTFSVSIIASGDSFIVMLVE